MKRQDKVPSEMDFGIRLKGTLADAFEFERRKAGAPKSGMVRTLLIEALRARGHEDIEDTLEWGGYRERKETEPGQQLGEPAL